MSGNNYNIPCPQCGATNELLGKALTLALTCQSCKIYFRVGKSDKSTVEFQHAEHQAIPLRSKGRIDGFVYEVMGFVVKEETKYHYRWREYLIFNPYRGYAFLSEYNGHWNFEWPIENDPRKKASDTAFHYDNSYFELYQKYKANVIQANGEFFFDVFNITASTINHEYIAPPFLLALEQSEDSVLWCQGEYLSQQEIADAFSIPKSKLPSKTGIGYTQPFNKAFSDQALIILSVFIFLLALFVQIIISNFASDAVIFQADYNKSDLKDQKLLTTPSFKLENGSKGLEVYVFASLNNDWFLSEFSLINEDDGTEYNFTKEVEYYSGYENGGAWSEGSQSGEAFLSQIPNGKYHLNIYPEFSPTNQFFSIAVRRDVPMYSNFFFTCLALLAFPLIYFLRKRNREQRRWSDSDYSPYSKD